MSAWFYPIAWSLQRAFGLLLFAIAALLETLVLHTYLGQWWLALSLAALEGLKILVIVLESTNQIVDRFHAEITTRFEALGKERIEVIRDREEQRLLHAVDRVHAMLDDLTANFESIIHEGVSAGS